MKQLKCVYKIFNNNRGNMKYNSKYRDFESTNYNINIPTDYDDKDLFGFKAGKIKVNKKLNLTGRNKMKKRI